MQEGGATSHTTQEQMRIFRRKGQTTFAKLHRHFPLPTGLIWSPAKVMVRHRVWEILLQLKDAALTRHSRHRTYCSGLGCPQPCKQRSLSENSQNSFLWPCFSCPYFLFSFLIYFMSKNGNREKKKSRHQGHLVYPKFWMKSLFDVVSFCKQVHFSSRVLLR